MNRVSENLFVDRPGTNQYLSGARGEGELFDNYIKVEWRDTAAPGSYFIVADEGGARKVIGKVEIPRGGHRGRIFAPVDAEGAFIVAGKLWAVNAERAIGVFTRSSPTADLAYDPAATSMLGEAGTRVSCICRPRRERAL
jgi:hypothetical protein